MLWSSPLPHQHSVLWVFNLLKAAMERQEGLFTIYNGKPVGVRVVWVNGKH